MSTCPLVHLCPLVDFFGIAVLGSPAVSKRLAYLGRRLREARERRGMRLRHAAKALRVSIATVHAYEQGDTHIPALRLVELADLYGLDLGRLSRHRALREAA